MSSPLLWGPNNTSNNLQNKIQLATGAITGVGLDAWTASTAYIVGQQVVYGQALYSCITAHTSSSTMETDLAGTSPKWVIVNKQPLSQNLMTFGADFECGDTSGWTACGCATVTNGLLASVGSGGAIFSSTNGGRTKGANTTSPAVVSSGQLDGSYSLNFATSGAGTIGDMYISSAYKIPIAFQSTVLQVKFKYKVVSGTPVMAGTSSNTYAAAIYDVDNNSWMPLVGAFNFVQSSGVGTFTGTTQVPYNSTQFQIAIYNPIAPTGASSLYVDDFYVGPQGIDSSSSVVATNVYRASTQSLTNATAQKVQFATINFDNGNCYDNATNYRYTAKTPGVYLINTQVVFAGNASNIRITMIYKNGSEIFRTHSNTNILAQSTYLPATYSVNLAAGDYIEVYAYQDTGGALNVGGSNTTYLSVQLVTSPSGLINSGVNACCVVNNGATTQTLTTSSSKITTLNTAISDPTGMYNSTNDRIYAYVSGQYRVSSSLRAESLAAGRRVTGQIYHTSGGSSTVYDAGELANPDATNAVIGVAVATLILTMKAGDYVELYGKVDSGTTAAGAYSLTNLTLERLSGPAVIAATETIGARYTNTTGSAVANTETVLDFPTKDYDSHSAVTTGASFKFRAPISGLYEVSVNCLTAASATASSLVGRLRKNGTAFKSTVFPRYAAVSTYTPLVIQSRVKLLAGEYVDFVLNETVDTNTLDTTAGANSFEVVRVGNYV